MKRGKFFLWMFLAFFVKIPLSVAQAGVDFTQTHVKRVFEKRMKAQAHAATQALLLASRKLKLDSMLLLSIIETESGFNPKRRGRHGEIGLMQLKPSTARWIAKKQACVGVAPPRSKTLRPTSSWAQRIFRICAKSSTQNAGFIWLLTTWERETFAKP